MRSLLTVGSFVAMILALVVCVATWETQASTPISYSSHTELVVDANGTVYQGPQFLGIFHEDKATGKEVLRLSLANPGSSSGSITNQIGITLDKDGAAQVLQTSVQSLAFSSTIHTEWQHDSYLKVSMYGTRADSYPALVLTAPHGYFNLPLPNRILDWIQADSLLLWFIAISGLVVLAGCYLLWRSRPVKWVASSDREAPPGDLRPLELAVLHHYVIQPLDIIALLYDLAQRGYLEVVDRGDSDVIFSRRSGQGKITDYEHNFLLLFFPEEGKPFRISQAIEKMNLPLLHVLITQSYVEIYDLFSKQGIFRENPRSIHIRYKTMGILFEVFGFMLTLLSFLFLRAPLPGMILLGIGFFGIGFMVYVTAYAVVPYSRLGREVIIQSAAFNHFLKSKKPLPWASVSSELFFRYAPYAATLHCMAPWLQRFRDHTRWEVPAWYGDVQDQLILPQYLLSEMNQVAGLLTTALRTNTEA